MVAAGPALHEMNMALATDCWRVEGGVGNATAFLIMNKALHKQPHSLSRLELVRPMLRLMRSFSYTLSIVDIQLDSIEGFGDHARARS